MKKFTDLLNIDAIRAATIAARDGSEADQGAEPIPGQDIANLISEKFGCYKDQVRELVEMLRGAPLPAPSKGSNSGIPTIGTIFHCGAEGTNPLLSMGEDSDGDIIYVSHEGRSHFIVAPKSWSYATDAQIDAFFNS